MQNTSEQPVREISIKLTPRSQEFTIWVMTDGLLICACNEAYMARGKRQCRHQLAAGELLSSPPAA